MRLTGKQEIPTSYTEAVRSAVSGTAAVIWQFSLFLQMLRSYWELIASHCLIAFLNPPTWQQIKQNPILKRPQMLSIGIDQTSQHKRHAVSVFPTILQQPSQWGCLTDSSVSWRKTPGVFCPGHKELGLHYIVGLHIDFDPCLITPVKSPVFLYLNFQF